MWNRLVKILQEPASKRLGLAIAISAALHTLFFGNLPVFLPIVKQEMHLIEARIQMPKAVPEPTTEPIAEALPVEPIVAPKIEQAKIEESTIEENIEPVAPATEPALDSAPVTPTPVETAEQKPSLEQELAPPQPNDIGLVVNESAYQYIETEFDVSTKIDGEAEGKAKITYNLVEGSQYHISWLTEGRGILALLFPELLQTSEGELTKTGLRPNSYLYQFGKKAEKNRAASFDWQAKKVTITNAKGTKSEELPDGTQDLLSFMYQFMHVAPLQHMQLPIVTGKKLRIYDYSFEGEEQINSALGEIKTIHILHSGNDEDKTELWLAIDYQYVPVKIRKIDSDGKVVEMLATRITTNRPVINQ